ncbi:hypothetical protein B0H10DRAFT_1965953 [Mycena sp. CBHHK59/15]|nr:hypothetical protein B0H10DRAFT_1965953 [Mycena sp. CBHHK59/15]
MPLLWAARGETRPPLHRLHLQQVLLLTLPASPSRAHRPVCAPCHSSHLEAWQKGWRVPEAHRTCARDRPSPRQAKDTHGHTSNALDRVLVSKSSENWQFNWTHLQLAERRRSTVEQKSENSKNTETYLLASKTIRDQSVIVTPQEAG